MRYRFLAATIAMLISSIVFAQVVIDISQEDIANGNLCGGGCTVDPKDNYDYFWIYKIKAK